MHAAVAFFPTAYSIPPNVLGLALEERGFESIWVAEHSHIPVSRTTPFPGGGELPQHYHDTLDPFVFLATLATFTTTLRLATGVCLVAQRDPIHTAKQVASLDQLSGGRFIFGVGAGWNEDEMNNHGTPLHGRFKLMRERVGAMKEIWTNDQAEYHGDVVDLDPLVMNPKPIQNPHPPIHVGGSFPGGARRAIEWANGWMPIHGRGKGSLADHVAEMRTMAVAAGRDPDEIDVSVYYAPADPQKLLELAEVGVDRAIFRLPSVDRDEAIESLDTSMDALRRAGLAD